MFFFQFLLFPTKAGYFGLTLVALATLDLQILILSNNRIMNFIDLVFLQAVVSATYDTLP